jgi:hypothetical protein
LVSSLTKINPAIERYLIYQYIHCIASYLSHQDGGGATAMAAAMAAARRQWQRRGADGSGAAVAAIIDLFCLRCDIMYS